MVAKPTKPARWADDGVSVPGRVEPSEGKKDQGFDNGEAPSAGEHNYQLGHVGDWIQYLEAQSVSGILQSFQAAAVGVATLSRVAQGKLPGAQPSNWVALGPAPDVRSSTDGLNWNARAYDAGVVGTPNEVLHTDVEGDALGEIGGFWFCGPGVGAGASKLQVSRNGNTWANASNATGAGDSMEALAVGQVAGQWAIGVCGQGDFVQYTDDGGISSTANSPGTGEDYYGIAWSSTLNLWVIVGTNGTILTSPDLATYTPRTPAAAYAGTFGRVRWDDRNLAFIATSDDGEIQRSIDGINWTQIQSGTGPDFQASRWLRIVRGVAIMAVKEAELTALWGFAYSTDGGATWSKFIHSLYAQTASYREGFNADRDESMIAGIVSSVFVVSTGRLAPE